MKLVYDANLPKNAAQTHALVIGVSDYQYLMRGSKFHVAPAKNSFGLPQLTSAALSAQAFANWLPALENVDAPLGTIDVLLSPGLYTPEHSKEVAVKLPTMGNIKTAFSEWSDRCNKNQANIGIFYFCGHGVEKYLHTVILPCDFGDPAERNVTSNMIDLDGTTLANLFECRAQTQLYFIDACRETNAALAAVADNPLSLISTSLKQQLTRDAPIFKSAKKGWPAHSRKGQVSFFTRALIDCLTSHGSRGKNGRFWEVTTSSLGVALRHYLARRIESSIPDLSPEIGGTTSFDTIIHRFLGPAYAMSSISCRPAEALNEATFAVRSGDANLFDRSIPYPAPFDIVIEPGHYEVHAAFSTPKYSPISRSQLIQPPFTPCTLEVE